MQSMSIHRNFSLDEETVQMLNRQAQALHISNSALIRLLILRNEEEKRG